MLAKNPMFHAKTKHIDVKYHFIQNLLKDKHIELVKVYTDDNLAYLLTKGLNEAHFILLCPKLGVYLASLILD